MGGITGLVDTREQRAIDRGVVQRMNALSLSLTGISNSRPQ